MKTKITLRLIHTKHNNPDTQLNQLIQHALHNHHLNPTQFNHLSSLCSRRPSQLINLILGALILNDQGRSREYMNQLHPIHYPELYPNLFNLCGLLGRGMGMMRRVVGAFQNHEHFLVHHAHSDHQTLKTRSKMVETMEAFIENLIRWGQIHRAWSYLCSFDFGPSIDLRAQTHRIGGSFATRVHRIHKSSESFRIWKPNPSAYSSLLSIYLILDRPDLALELEAKVDLSKMDQPMALIICARALISQQQQPELTHLHQFNLASIPGPITTSVLAKAAYQRNGPAGLTEFLSNLHRSDPPPNRFLLSAWLDILMTSGGGEEALEPAELGSWIELIDQEGLLGERELEKYLRYTREWLELELNQKLRLNHSSRDHHLSLPSSSVSVDPDDPRLGYHQLFKFVNIVYHHPSSNLSSSSSSAGDNNPNHHQFKPSTLVTSELIRICSLTGTKSEQLSELIDKEVLESQTQIRSSHMIGLIWSKVVDRDLIGLDNLVEREMKFKYKLVLTGLLTSIILAGLIAIRVPKPIIIKISQQLIDQCPTTTTKNTSSSQRNVHQIHHLDDQQDTSLESHLKLIQVAQSIGDMMLIKDIHESIVQKFGRERLFLGANDGTGGRSAHDGVGLDYLRLIFEVYTHFNQPLDAHLEVVACLKVSDRLFPPPQSLKTGQIEENSHRLSPDLDLSLLNHHPEGLDYHENKRFLSSGVLESYLDFRAVTKLFRSPRGAEGDEDGKTQKAPGAGDEAERMQKFEQAKLVKSLMRSRQQIGKRIDELRKLKKLFGRPATSDEPGDGCARRRVKEKVDEEWERKQLDEIEGRLLMLVRAAELNTGLMAALVDPRSPHPALPPSRLPLITPLHRPPRWRDRSWKDSLLLGWKLVRKSVGS